MKMAILRFGDNPHVTLYVIKTAHQPHNNNATITQTGLQTCSQMIRSDHSNNVSYISYISYIPTYIPVLVKSVLNLQVSNSNELGSVVMFVNDIVVP